MRVTPIDFAALLKRLDPEHRHVVEQQRERRGGLTGAIAEGVKAQQKRPRLTPPPETTKENGNG